MRLRGWLRGRTARVLVEAVLEYFDESFYIGKRVVKWNGCSSDDVGFSPIGVNAAARNVLKDLLAGPIRIHNLKRQLAAGLIRIVWGNDAYVFRQAEK